jgi:hypothetical protein
LLYPAELRAHIAGGCNFLKIAEFAAESKPLANVEIKIRKEMVRPERFELPTLWFEA